MGIFGLTASLRHDRVVSMQDEEFKKYIADYIITWHKKFIPVGERMEALFKAVKEKFKETKCVSAELWAGHLRGEYIGGIYTMECFGSSARESTDSSEKRLEILAYNTGKIVLTVNDLDNDRLTTIYKGGWRELGEEGAWECADTIVSTKAFEDPLFFYIMKDDLSEWLDDLERLLKEVK